MEPLSPQLPQNLVLKSARMLVLKLVLKLSQLLARLLAQQLSKQLAQPLARSLARHRGRRLVRWRRHRVGCPPPHARPVHGRGRDALW